MFFGISNIIGGIIVIAYAIIKYWQRKSLKSWLFKRAYCLVVMTGWGFGLLLLGIHEFWEPLQITAFLVSGMTFLMMIGVPCSVSIFNERGELKVIRNIVFAVIGVTFILGAMV